MLFDTSLVEGFRVFGSVSQMFAVGACKVVCTGKVLFGAHIQVVVLDMVQYGIDTDDGRDTDGAGRQADVPVSVVGAFYVQVVMVNSSEGEIAQGKLDRRGRLAGACRYADG